MSRGFRRRHQRVVRALASRALREGASTYGALDLDSTALRSHLEQVLARTGARARTLHAGDLFAACAVESGVPGAWESVLRVHEAALRQAICSRGVAIGDASEVVRDLPATTLLEPGDGEHRTRLGAYDGRGSLRTWLAVIAVRAWLRERRRADAQARAHAERPIASAADNDPLALAAAREEGARMATRLRAAWSSLTPNARLALALRFVHRVAGRDIAVALGVGEPRVSRIVESAIGTLRSALAADSARGEPSLVASMRSALAAELANLAARDLPLAHGDDPVASG